jgi:hypothetical protein
MRSSAEGRPRRSLSRNADALLAEAAPESIERGSTLAILVVGECRE